MHIMHSHDYAMIPNNLYNLYYKSLIKIHYTFRLDLKSSILSLL